ncbi:MAG: Holliday junction branch migration protein RuvA [Chitinophagaceae bacterium]
MIAYLQGKFTHKTPTVVFVDVQGVGYEVNISLNTYGAIQDKEQGSLYTYLQIKEDAHILYGFSDLGEKSMFLKLIGISGVGASTARMMLSSMKHEEVAQAIAQGNSGLLESIKGIGKKTAERIVLELKDKLSKTDHNISNSTFIHNTLEQDALNALMSLGISRVASENAVKKVIAGHEKINLEQLIKKALQVI